MNLILEACDALQLDLQTINDKRKYRKNCFSTCLAELHTKTLISYIYMNLTTTFSLRDKVQGILGSQVQNIL
jgi:hypothetical protein